MLEKTYNILMQGTHLEGGQWHVDKQHRKKYPGNPKVPKNYGFEQKMNILVKELEEAGRSYPGICTDAVEWVAWRKIRGRCQFADGGLTAG